MTTRDRLIGLGAGLLLLMPASVSGQGGPSGERLTVVNLIPWKLSGETYRDAEQTLSINPEDPLEMVVTSMTPNPNMQSNYAPIFYSQDGGASWQLRVRLYAGGPEVNDATGSFATDGRFYAGILMNQPSYTMSILRARHIATWGGVARLKYRDDSDQPHVRVRSTPSDVLFVGFKDLDRVDYSGSRTNTSTVAFDHSAQTFNPSTDNLTIRHIGGQSIIEGLPPVKTVLAGANKVYVAYYANQDSNDTGKDADLVLVRDDYAGSGPPSSGAWTPPQFCELTTVNGPNCNHPCCKPGTTDKLRGGRVAPGLTVPGFFGGSADYLGHQAMKGSTLDIAVHPSLPSNVWIAYADVDPATGEQSLHLTRSVDGGKSWLDLQKDIQYATNPVLHINVKGVVGFLYQQLTLNGWQTHFERSEDDGKTWSDLIIAQTPDNVAQPGDFFIGDYADVESVGDVWYGVFSAANHPYKTNYKNAAVITYQRRHSFSAHELRDLNGQAVETSIDPYFFKLEPPRNFKIRPCISPSCSSSAQEIKLPACGVLPCGFTDPLPSTCLGPPCCTVGVGLCPPWHHIRLENLGGWEVRLTDAQGADVPSSRWPIPDGFIISFRPSANPPPNSLPYQLEFVRRHSGSNKPAVVQRRVWTSQYPDPFHAKP